MRLACRVTEVGVCRGRRSDCGTVIRPASGVGTQEVRYNMKTIKGACIV